MNRSTLAALTLTVALLGCDRAGGDGSRARAPARYPPDTFSGLNWSAKQYLSSTWGPGPNYFSPTDENIWVDERGWLHLRISQRGGQWYCAELISEVSPGYGTYVFTLGSRGDTLDPNVVLGLFTWDDDLDPTQVNAWREIDFEFSRWGQPQNQNFQFVVQPWDLSPANLHRFQIDNAVSVETVHGFTWSPSGITFTSAYGTAWPPAAKDVIASWSYAGPATPTPRAAQVRMNLWLVNGQPPSDGQPQEMIVERFEFIPP